jgi:transcriptional regulator with XRE-family HTH domain
MVTQHLIGYSVTIWGQDVTPEQCKMARAALGLGVRELAEKADVSPNTITRLERGESMQRRTVDTLRTALEAAGVIFIGDAEASVSGGPGVRLSVEPPSEPGMITYYRNLLAGKSGNK